MKLVWTQEALDRLDDIELYLGVQEKAPEAAKRQIENIFNRESQIIDMPLSGRMVPDYQIESIREILEGSYRIIYKIEEAQILVLSVLHQSRLLRKANELQRALKSVEG